MKDNYLIRLEDLVNNPTPRVPICLCLDTSGSMAAVEGACETTGEVAVYSAEICIVTFDSKATCVMDFANLDRQEKIPQLRPTGDTAMGEGVTLALDLLKKRKQEYKDKGVDYYQPWLVLMTDGVPNGNPEQLNRAINRTRKMVDERKLTVFPIGIGNESDMSVLDKFSPGRKALKLQGMKFQEFFAWLSKSVSKTSQSMPGESIKLDVEGIKGWAEL